MEGWPTAIENLDNFREVGEWKKFYDEVNATPKEMHGFLATLPHKHTGLPAVERRRPVLQARAQGDRKGDGREAEGGRRAPGRA